MPEQHKPLTDGEVVTELLRLGSNAADQQLWYDAAVLVYAATRILELPNSLTHWNHPSGKVPTGTDPIQAVVDAILNFSDGDK